jgi:hypothetical protein
MFHLIKAQLHAASGEQRAATHDPVVAATLDCRNAFNCLFRQHLVDFLDTGCAEHASLIQDEEHDKPVGWDILYNHLRAHYGICGHLKYYSQSVEGRSLSSKVPLGYSKETLCAVCSSPLVSTPSY